VAVSAHAAHTQARLILAAETARPGDTVLAGVLLRMEPHWHTYWKNAGASGIATSIKWDLPAGITAGEIQWPVPEKLPPDDLTTYVYENEVVLLVPLKLASDLPPGPRELKAKVAWLECKELCVPGNAAVSATLVIGNEPKPSADAALLESWRGKAPKPFDELTGRVEAWWEKSADGDTRPLIIGANAARFDFYPDDSDTFEVQGASEKFTVIPGRVHLRKLVKKFEGDWPKEISGLLVTEIGGQRQGVEIKLMISDKLPGAAATAGSTSGSNASPAPLAQPLWLMLAYAFIGGLILNVMPCVLPVIALKILGFVGEARSNPRQVRKLGLVYALGVLASFLALAGLVIGVKAAGHKAGWGMQFSNPQFIVLLIVVVTLVALNLFGVFEVTLGGRVMSAAGTLSSKQGSAGAFSNGVLATVLATPCTAPFLGAALGFAFAQTAPVTILMFLTVGTGLASPYVILSWQPAWLKFLPKPGAWMEKFKVAMGFPMLATAIWLLSVVSVFYGERSWWLFIFLVFLAVAAWVFGEFVQRGRSRRGLAAGIVAALLVIGYSWVVEGKLRWRAPVEETDKAGHPAEISEGLAWQKWSPDAVTTARSEGRPVVVDFTAKWCFTCNTIVGPALNTPAVKEKLKQLNAVALLADYTRFPEDISQELSRFGRAGVPMVLVYPGNPDEAPIVVSDPLPLQLPSQYARVVLEAIDRLAR
jgi:thiol:disulfide interchange protein